MGTPNSNSNIGVLNKYTTGVRGRGSLPLINPKAKGRGVYK